jgi:2-keto-4-pentenoate hydratase/2-oxohepta-3-ene-1,7-dioic acid hydratase in catechol pathway
VHGAATALGHGAADAPTDVVDIIAAGPELWEKVEDLSLEIGSGGDEGRGEWWWPTSEVTFDPPFMPPKNPWVVGANYYQHLANGFARIPRPAVVPPHPEFFTKAMSSLIGHEGDIVYDKKVTVTMDFETEFAVVIGRGGRDIPAGEALDHIFGYTVTNDVSARELQIGHRQYFRGKGLDGFCPMGPVVVTRRDIPNPYALTITTRVNGHQRQHWPVGDMLYKLDELISVLSQGMTLEPGDVIICGTVAGTGFEQMPQVWLQHGDVIESEIAPIGVLRNTVKMAGV